MVPDSGEGTGRLMVTSHSRALARNFSCGQFIVVCGGDWYSGNGLQVGEFSNDVAWFIPQYCDEFSPSQCTGGSPVSSGSANFNWYSVGGSTVARLNSSSDQYVSDPNIYGVGPGTGYANIQATAGSCSAYGGGGFPVSPTVTLVLGPNGSHIVTGGSGQPMTNTQLTASGTPSGGIYQWTTSTGAVSLSGTSGQNVTATASSAGQTTLTVTYSISGQPASATQVITVQQPAGFSVVTGTDTGNEIHQCQYTDKTFAYNGVQRRLYYQLMDNASPAPTPININGIAMTETYSTINDRCGFGTTPSTANGPTSGAGKWGDGFVDCVDACNPSSTNYHPTCQSTFNHKWMADGIVVLNRTVTYACQSITP
jgi:hypothetical protein